MVLFNFSSHDETRSQTDAGRLGIKAAYLSNSFAAYRLAALGACGGFPSHLIAGEDCFAAVQLLLAGWRIRYCAAARVRHSHAYTVLQEMQRHFDWGVMHAQMPELLRQFGGAEGEGMRFVISELQYLRASAPHQLPLAPLRNAAKYAGYRLGRVYRWLPPSLCRELSMTKVFWSVRGAAAPRRASSPDRT